MTEDHNPELSKKCMEIVECDTARIAKYDDFYLIIGFNRNTKDNLGQEEKCVASGKTEDDLIKSAKRYKKLCEMTMEEYLTEIVNGG